MQEGEIHRCRLNNICISLLTIETLRKGESRWRFSKMDRHFISATSIIIFNALRPFLDSFQAIFLLKPLAIDEKKPASALIIHRNADMGNVAMGLKFPT